MVRTGTMLPVFSGYMLRVTNTSFYEGTYHPEDDWEMDFIADTQDDTAKKFWLEYPQLDIFPLTFRMFSVEYVVSERGSKIVTRMNPIEYDTACDAFQKYKLAALNARRIRMETIHTEQAKRLAKQREEEEMAMLKELREKYEQLS